MRFTFRSCEIKGMKIICCSDVYVRSGVGDVTPAVGLELRKDFLRRPMWLERVRIVEESGEVIKGWLPWGLNRIDLIFYVKEGFDFYVKEAIIR